MGMGMFGSLEAGSLAGSKYGLDLLRYRKNVGYIVNMSIDSGLNSGLNSSSPGPSSFPFPSSSIVAIVVPIGVFLLLLGLGVLLVLHRTTKRTLTGAVRVPPASAKSTLVVTDIKSSTKLWENLDPQVRVNLLAL